MINKIWLVALFLSLAVNVINAQEGTSLNTEKIKFDFNVLAEKKKAVQSKDASLMPAYKELIKTADKLLKYQPVSVMDKKKSAT